MTWWTNPNTQIKQKFRFFVEISDSLFLFNIKSVSKPSAQIETKEFQLINHKFNYPGIVTWQPIKITMVDMRGNALDEVGFSSTSTLPTDEFGNYDNNSFQLLQNNTFDTAKFLYAMLKFSGYDIPTSRDHPISMNQDTWREISSPEKASTIANAFGPGLQANADFSNAKVGTASNNQSIRIYLIDPRGFVVEKWVLHNPIIKSINWGDLDYGSDDAIEYTLDVAYDFATMDYSQETGKPFKPTSTKFNSFVKEWIKNEGLWNDNKTKKN